MLMCRYCRIVAADLLLRLAVDPDFTDVGLSGTNCIKPMLELLQLQQVAQDVQEEQVLEVAHLAYERSHEVIVMKGYRFHKAKLVATLAIGHLSHQFPQTLAPAADQLTAMTADLKAMLRSPVQTFRSAAAAALADLCSSSIDVARTLIQVLPGCPVLVEGAAAWQNTLSEWLCGIPCNAAVPALSW